MRVKYINLLYTIYTTKKCVIHNMKIEKNYVCFYVCIYIYVHNIYI